MIQRKRWTIIALVIAVFVLNSTVSAVNTQDIDDVLEQHSSGNKAIDTADSTVIDQFLDSAIAEMLNATELSEAVDLRSEIIKRKGNENTSKYSAKFVELLDKHLNSALIEVQRILDDKLRKQMTRNLIILVASVQDIDLAHFALDALSNDDITIRYWAVKAMANQAVSEQIKAGRNKQIASEILDSFGKLVQMQNHGEILQLLTQFAANHNGSDGNELLLKIADVRITAYRNWAVEYEFVDVELLKALGNNILSEKSDQKNLFGRKFGRLYSCMIQRFVLGEDALRPYQKSRLASAITEVEQSTVSRLMGVPRTALKNAVEKSNYPLLRRQHDSLLGSTAMAGELGEKYKFDYGTTDGRKSTAPDKLPPAPKPKPSAADDEQATNK